MLTTAPDVDKYISRFQPAIKAVLSQLRKTIKAAAPDAEETISYAMPAYKLNGMLVYFAGYAGHVGFYPGAGGIAEFRDEIARYKHAKGSVQFPLDEPLPVDLIQRMVKFRVKQNLNKAKNKGK